MDRLAMIVVIVLFMFGFITGYAVRAEISRRRRYRFQ
jgi:hypothetical protein